MLLLVMVVGFENTCTVSGKWNVSRVIPRLYGWVYKTWRLFPLADEHSIAVMIVGSQIVSYGTHDSFWLVVSTAYFYILYLWPIVVLHFLPLETHKHLVLPLSSITFTANNQADNHFYNYIYLFQIFIQYEISFLLRYTLRFLVSKFDLTVKYRPYYF